MRQSGKMQPIAGNGTLKMPMVLRSCLVVCRFGNPKLITCRAKTQLYGCVIVYVSSM